MHDKKKSQGSVTEESVLTPTYAAREMTETIPRHQIPEQSNAPQTIYNVIHDELILDGNSRQNLATFVTTWMEPEAEQLMSECFDKNMIDKDEYPQTAEIENRCVNMLAKLWNSPEHETATGTSTIGSSEAAMLGGMAMKWNWRDKVYLPEDLVFHVRYLGGDMADFSINFSRPGNQVVAQYYNFLRLGMDGYRRIHQACQDVAVYLSAEIAKLGPFELITNGSDIPVFCWKLKDEAVEKGNFSLFDMADKLREHGWLVPAYPMPPNRQDLIVQRIVVKEGFSRDMADMLLKDMHRALEWFGRQPDYIAKKQGSHFSH